MLNRLLAAALGIAVSLGFSELALRWLAPQEASWLDIYRQEPGLPYYTMSAELRQTIETGEGLWHIHTDGRGRRVAREPGSPGADAPLLLVLGDSFAFGQGVEYEDSFVGQLARQLGDAHRVVNTAVGGHGPVQYRQILEAELAAGERPRALLVSIFVGNDFYDCVWDKRLVVIDGAIATGDHRARAWLKRNLHLYRLASKLYQRFGPARGAGHVAPEELYREAAWNEGALARARSAFATELGRIAELARGVGAHVVVALIPTAEAVADGATPGHALPMARAREALADLPVTTLDLTPTLRSLGARRAYLAHDGHLTPEAGLAVADALWPLVRDALAPPS